MDAHQFGIMQNAPAQDDVFVEYEPQKYNLITVPDEIIQPMLDSLSQADCFWHSLNRPEKGLTYTGISLIPPSSVDCFLSVFKQYSGTDSLTALFRQAKESNKFIIHYGL